MTSDLRPYPEYKDSGVPWVGGVPTHWECLPHRALFEEVKNQGHVDEPLLSVTISKGVIRQADLLANSSKKDSSNFDKSKYKLVEPEDIAYNKMRAWQGAVGVSRYRGIVSPAYIVVRLRTRQNPEYFHYLFRTPGFAKEAERSSYGITSDQWSLRPEHFKMIYSSVPPRDEQDTIVSYLRDVEKRINRFIRNRRRLIAVLNEQKQAIINRAVTRGLDPNAPLKPSGIDWLGNVPEHWEMKKLRFIADSQGGMTPSKADESFWNGSIPWVTPKDMKRAEIADSIDHITDTALNRTNIRLIEPPVVLIVVRGMILAKTVPVAVTTASVTINQDMKALLLRPCVDPTFMRNLLVGVTNGIRPLVEESGHGTRVLRTDLWRNMVLPIPPIEEQQSINCTIMRDTAKVETSISKTQAEIDLIREYRTRLIADVVTGKVDVRGLAPSEPLHADQQFDEGIEDDEMPGDDEPELDEEAAHADD
jgi:type I restriction enzyme S subunit